MTAVAEIAELVRREAGIVLPRHREAAILAAVNRAAPGLDPDAFLRAASDPARGRALVDRLIDEVTVQETAFVRDRAQLDSIAWSRLLHAAHAAGSGTIRVWSAGCASGEEAYTLALLAAEAFAPAPPPVDVLGTDISGAALAAATTGRYHERSVRALDPALRRRYLDRQDDGSYLVGGQLRRLVRLRRHNLARDQIPPLGEPGFDLIACRNVLIYFEPPLGRAGDRIAGAGAAAWRAAAARARRRPAPGPRPAAAGPARLRRSRPSGPCADRSAPRPSLSREQRLAAALAAADQGDHDAALAHVAVAARRQPAGLPTRTTSTAWSRSERAGPPGRRPRCAARSTPTRASGSRRSPSAGPTTRSVTTRPPGEPTSRPCARSTRRTTGTSACSSRWTSATSPRPAGPGSAGGRETGGWRPQPWVSRLVAIQ